MSARTFGTDDQQALFFDRYSTDSYEATGEAIREAQRAAAPVRSQDITREHPNRATDKAINWMITLWTERSTKSTPERIRAWAITVDRSIVSEKIDWLKTQPKLAAPKTESTPDVPAGRYAVTGENGQTVFLKVDRPVDGPYAGQTFVRLQVSDETRNVGYAARTALLGKIVVAGPKEAMLRYGREIGSCGHCGRTLTNEESREAGIGPVCRGKMGW